MSAAPAAIDPHLSPVGLARLTPVGLARLVFGRKYLIEHFTAHLSARLVDVAVGRIKRLIVTMPPRHGKSALCSHIFPAWYLGNYPDNRFILTSYEAGFAAEWGRKSRDVLEQYGPDVFGVSVNQRSSAAAAWNIVRQRDGAWIPAFGGMNTAGAGGPITGKGAHIFQIDDPVKNGDEARSQRKREKQLDWYKSTAYTRLNDDPEGAVILIMTRWHEDDLAGALIKDQMQDEFADTWHVVNFPAIATDNDLLGRQPGEALSRRYPAARLKRIQRTLGSYWFGALYQQTPTPPDGNVFRPRWMHYASAHPDHMPVPNAYDIVVQIWDTAEDNKDGNDYAACATIGYVASEQRCYVIDIWRGKLDTPDLLREIKRKFAITKPDFVLIEQKSTGTSLVQLFRRPEHKLPVPVLPIPVKSTESKVARAETVTPYFEDGRVVFLKFPGLADFETELFAFPNAPNDDRVDVLVHGLRRLFSGSLRRGRTV